MPTSPSYVVENTLLAETVATCVDAVDDVDYFVDVLPYKIFDLFLPLGVVSIFRFSLVSSSTQGDYCEFLLSFNSYSFSLCHSD